MRLTGYKNSCVVDWGKRFRDNAVVSPLYGLCKRFKAKIIDFAPAEKRKLGSAKSSRNCKVPNLCVLQFGYVDVQTAFHAPAISCITLSM